MKKLAFVLPWYAEAILGGAELDTRNLAERLSQRGWDIEILTTCLAGPGQSWDKNVYEPGLTRVGNLPTRRFRVQARDTDLFEQLNKRLVQGIKLSREEEAHFIEEMIKCPDLIQFISDYKQAYCFVFSPYFFSLTHQGVRVAPEQAWVIPRLHDEPYAYMQMTKETMRLATGLIFCSRAERDLAEQCFDIQGTRSGITGNGLDTHIAAQGNRFRAKYSLNDPFILCVARKSTAKNIPLLINYFGHYHQQRQDKLKLLLIGPGTIPIPRNLRDCILDLGVVSDQDKYDAYQAADLFCQPSVNEAFSLVIMEAWLCGTPVLVNGHCAVTRDDVSSSNGGLYFEDYAEFAACIDYFRQNPEKAQKMAHLGRQYVEANFTWDQVLERFINLIQGSL